MSSTVVEESTGRIFPLALVWHYFLRHRGCRSFPAYNRPPWQPSRQVKPNPKLVCLPAQRERYQRCRSAISLCMTHLAYLDLAAVAAAVAVVVLVVSAAVASARTCPVRIRSRKCGIINSHPPACISSGTLFAFSPLAGSGKLVSPGAREWLNRESQLDFPSWPLAEVGALIPIGRILMMERLRRRRKLTVGSPGRDLRACCAPAGDAFIMALGRLQDCSVGHR